MTQSERDELKRLVEAATPGPWKWGIQDYSMATLDGPKDAEQHVLSIAPCPSCMDEAKQEGEWKWGRCMTPSQEDADYILAACNAIPDLLAENERMRRLLTDISNFFIDTRPMPPTEKAIKSFLNPKESTDGK